MTNQNVAAADAESDISAAITQATASSVPAAEAPRPPQPNRGFFAVSRRQFLNKLDVGGGGGERINAWVDSMRASSPTHANDASLFLPDDNSWTIGHPSALQMFDEITKASKGKQIVMFLDYDGTLSPIVADPDRAFMSREMRAAVRDLAQYFPTAIVSGRCREKVYGFVKLSQLYYAGSHGMDIKGPTNAHRNMNQNYKASQMVQFQPASEFLHMIDEVNDALLEKIKSTPGAKVENNKFCISVHFRNVEEERWKALAEDVRTVVSLYPKLRLTQGRKVLEIRPTIKWDKGRALEFLLESLGYGNSDEVLPIYIGDDRTDEDAFKVLQKRGLGIGILVSKVPKETSASYSLREPSEVMEFLRRLVEWKSASVQVQ